MSRRFQLLWIPVLAAILAGPVATRSSGDLRAEVLRGGGSIDSPPQYPLPIARSVLVLQARPQPYRQSGPSWAAVPNDLGAHGFERRLLPVPVRAGAQALAGTARHFPLFPTGPPAHR